jgi:membrane-bound lytic murein transglycosylase D
LVRASRFLHALVAVIVTLSLTGCLGLAHQPQRSQIQQDPPRALGHDANETAPPGVSEEEAPEVINSPGATNASLREVSPEDLAHQQLAEAQALYATGVAANRDGRWQDAQVSFEQATGLISDIEIESSEDTGEAAAVSPEDELEQELSTLLREIAAEYRKTLIAIGDLDSDASLLAFLLRYESLESIREEHPDSTVELVIEQEEESGQVEYDFPVVLNDQVKNCIVYFQTVAREPFETYLRRAGQYLPIMKEIVASYGLPTDIAYLPLIESGFNSQAYSYAHASGPWQFISSTGRKYGLKRTTWIDERRDFEKATHAACQYLKDLYEMFGKWDLALASYNGGEGRVSRQIKRQRTDDFWKLRLHRQTRNYVPLFMGALMIAKDPEAFGFHVEPDPPIKYDWVATNKALELKDISRVLGCPVEALANLNPELRRDVTPPDIKPYRFRVPKGMGERFAHVYHNLPESERTQFAMHRVKRGETLSGIASRYGTSASAIAKHNKMRSMHYLRVGQMLEIPVPKAALAYHGSSKSSRSSGGSSSSGGRYRVKRGDTLWELAKKFGTTTSAIRRANNMGAHSKLIAGRTITIPGRSTSRDGGSFWYTIKRGDTMSRIAARYGVALRKLIASNKSVNPDRIIVGQRILIPAL